MTADAFLDWCLEEDNALQTVLDQLEKAGKGLGADGILDLHDEGRRLQRPIPELADALSGLVRGAEEVLAQAAQSALLPDGGPSDTAMPGHCSKGWTEIQHTTVRPASLHPAHFSATNTCSERSKEKVGSSPLVKMNSSFTAISPFLASFPVKHCIAHHGQLF